MKYLLLIAIYGLAAIFIIIGIKQCKALYQEIKDMIKKG
jgi:hypothetical protein